MRMHRFFTTFYWNYENDVDTHNYFSLFSYWHSKLPSGLRNSDKYLLNSLHEKLKKNVSLKKMFGDWPESTN